jgi:YggT family protein
MAGLGVISAAARSQLSGAKLSGTLILTYIDVFVWAFTGILLVRIILSYVAAPTNKLFQLAVDVTEPLLSPLRAVMPKTPGIDFSPVALFFILQILQQIAHRLI